MKIVFGTRGSELALKQTNLAISELQAVAPFIEPEIKIVKTLGDSKQGTSQAAISDKQDWIQGLDTALVNGQIDIAIHSAKDVPVDIHPASQIYALGEREDCSDLLIVKDPNYKSIDDLPEKALIGTASLRRQAQLLNYRPDLRVKPFRGNVNKRIENFYNDEHFSAIVLAAAGINRIKARIESYAKIDRDIMLPAVNQGCIVAHIMLHRNDLISLIKKASIPEVQLCFEAERQCIHLLEANCHSAVGVYATIENEQMSLSCNILMPDGSKKIEHVVVGKPTDHYKLSEELAEKLVMDGASRILAESNNIRAGWR